MRIKENKIEDITIEFQELEMGDCYRVKGDDTLYMKTEVITDIKGTAFNTVDIETGEMFTAKDVQDVILVDGYFKREE